MRNVSEFFIEVRQEIDLKFDMVISSVYIHTFSRNEG